MTQPQIATGQRNHYDERVSQSGVRMWDLGSCPVASVVELRQTGNENVLVYRGYVIEQRGQWGYTKVLPVAEGDGNFIGQAETWYKVKVRWEGEGGARKQVQERVSNGTLTRLYDMDKVQYVQARCPVVWLGVDEEVRRVLVQDERVLVQAGEGEVVEESAVGLGGAPGAESNTILTSIPLLPVVSLVVTEEGGE